MSKQFTDNDEFEQRVSDRWRRNRNRVSDDEPEEWYVYQCYNCAFFIRLSGAFFDNWGACSNGNSKCDGTVMNEHDGCEEHKFATVQFNIVEYARELLEEVDNTTDASASSEVAKGRGDGE